MGYRLFCKRRKTMIRFGILEMAARIGFYTVLLYLQHHQCNQIFRNNHFEWIDGRWKNDASDKKSIAFMLNSTNNIRNLRKYSHRCIKFWIMLTVNSFW